MSLIEIKVPQLSESVAEATLLQWKKKVGEPVARDEILIEIETDKVVLEVPAPDAGVLTSIEMQDGATVVSDQLIARLDTSANAAVGAASPAPAAATPAAVAAPTAATPPPGRSQVARLQALRCPPRPKFLRTRDAMHRASRGPAETAG